MTVAALDDATYRAALAELARRDADLVVVLDELGPPPMWDREPGFATLIHIILEQQVSLASAKACFDRLVGSVGELTPDTFAALSDATLKSIGFSRQKVRYARILADAIRDRTLDLGELEGLGDNEVRSRLTALVGIGPWTADIYLLMALRRPDVWPAGDLALISAAQRVKGLKTRPSAEELARLGEAWRPWRSVAARLLWHRYLADRR